MHFSRCAIKCMSTFTTSYQSSIQLFIVFTTMLTQESISHMNSMRLNLKMLQPFFSSAFFCAATYDEIIRCNETSWRFWMGNFLNRLLSIFFMNDVYWAYVWNWKSSDAEILSKKCFKRVKLLLEMSKCNDDVDLYWQGVRLLSFTENQMLLIVLLL